ncbi:hypothetical protein D3C85_1754670 [compost metagenome]
MRKLFQIILALKLLKKLLHGLFQFLGKLIPFVREALQPLIKIRLLLRIHCLPNIIRQLRP